MRKIYFYIAILSTVILFSSCNDEWEDELYTRMVSLKAPINRDDVSVLYLRYKSEGKVTYKLPVIVSGSKQNDKAYDVKIGVDNDTLAILNYARYTDREDLYYRQLPEQFYEFESPICHIPVDSNTAVYKINFKFEGLDLVEKWVLPLTIEKDPSSYEMNMYKGRRKALLWVLPFNDYSGIYSATDMKVFFGDETSNNTVVSSRESRVVDDNTIFFYAGITEEKNIQRGLYKIKVNFVAPHETLDDGAKRGKLVLSADDEGIGFETLSDPYYEIREEMDIESPHIKKRTISLYMKYKYVDYTSALHKLPYRCEGSMTMQRKINILIPDEDQAVIW